MGKLKRFISIILVLFLIIVMPINVLANEPTVMGAPLNDPGPSDYNTPSRQNTLNAKRESARNNIDSAPKTRIAGYILLNINNVIQEQQNWCGVACVKMIRNHYKITDGTQRTLAKLLGIENPNGPGAQIDHIEALLNRSISTTHYEFITCNTTYDDFFEDLEFSLEGFSSPVLAQVNTASLTKYKGYALTHYVLVTGCTGDPGKGNLWYNDPNYMTQYSGKNISDSQQNMYRAINNFNGWYLW